MTLLAVLFVYQIAEAQDYKFGKISKEELQEQFNPLDSSASATFLYKYRKTFYKYQEGDGFNLITEIHERVKIYNQEGFKYATEEIMLYNKGGANEKFTGLKANTYNLVNGEIEVVKLQKGGVFSSEYNEFLDQKTFTMPNIKIGSIIEYKYRITSPFISNVDEFIFQEDIPIKELKASFEVPEYFNFKVSTKGFLSVIPEIETKRDKLSTQSNLEFTKDISRYNLYSIPALKEEPYVNNINNYRSAIKYELSFTKFPNTIVKYYSTTWEDVVKTIYENPSFGAELDKTSYYEADIDALIGSVSDPMQRATLIFEYVKSKMKWNGYYGKYTRDGVRKVYKEQVGNVAEINLMLTSMLRYAGLNANPVLVSTRENGIPLFPTREGYNYVVASVKISEGTVLLDATNKYSMPNVLPYRALNWQGRVIAEHGGSTLIDLYPRENSKNTVTMMVKLSEDGNIEGGCRSMKTNHDAMLYRQKYNETNEDDFIEKLENKYNGLEISDFKVTNTLDLSKPVIESYKFVKESQADIIGDKIYVSPLFFLATLENPFKLETREFPVDFGYPSIEEQRIVVNLPEGYAVESIPESKAISLPDNLGTFKYNLIASGGKIQLILKTDFNSAIISPIYYDALKEYFNQLVEKESEQIVLTKG